MANEDDLGLILEGVAAWNKWRDEIDYIATEADLLEDQGYDLELEGYPSNFRNTFTSQT